MMEKLSIRDMDLRGKKVLLRVDFNVPVFQGAIKDNLRIVSVLPTLRHLIEKGARTAIVSHRGRPGGEVDENYSMSVCASELSKLLGKPVPFLEECVGQTVNERVNALSEGELLFLENVRFHREEESKQDEERRKFAQVLSEPFDLVVNDAFGVSHRKNASVYDVSYFKEVVMGFLMEKEIHYLGKMLETPKRPFLGVMGGAKVSDKLTVIEKLLPNLDKLAIGGGMAYTFYAAMGYPIGKSLLDKDLVAYCKMLLEDNSQKILLPVDDMVAEGFDFKTLRPNGDVRLRKRGEMTESEMGIDVGIETRRLFGNAVTESETVFWNGPMGIFECPQAAEGTFAVAKSIAQRTERGAVTIVGGGDSVSAIREMGYDKKVSHVSTGGGASLEFITHGTLPALEIIKNK